MLTPKKRQTHYSRSCSDDRKRQNSRSKNNERLQRDALHRDQGLDPPFPGKVAHLKGLGSRKEEVRRPVIRVGADNGACTKANARHLSLPRSFLLP
jgi:hypothetical protein